MWIVSGEEIKMTVGDFGIELPIKINGIEFSENDMIKFELKKEPDRSVALTKTFSNVTENTINLVLTEAQSNNLPVGEYVYSLDWYQAWQFMCNIVNGAKFKVVAKA